MKLHSVALTVCLQGWASFTMGSELHLRGGMHVDPIEEAPTIDGSIRWELPPWRPMGQPLVMDVEGFGTYHGKIGLTPDGKTMAMGTYLEDKKDWQGIAGFGVATYTYVEKARKWIPLDDNVVVELPVQGAGGDFDMDVSDHFMVISKVGYSVSGPDEIKMYVLMPSRDQTRWFDIFPSIANDEDNKEKEAFGKSVALAEADDNYPPIVAVGIPGRGGDREVVGRVQVYKMADGDGDDEFKWEKLGPSIPGNSMNFGENVKLSKNGMVLAIAEARMSDDGQPLGLVLVFEFCEKSRKWIQKGTDIVSDWFPFDNMDLSSDGSTVVAGESRSSNDQPEPMGHVRVWWYDEAKEDWVQKGVDVESLAPECLEPPKNGYMRFGKTVSLSGDGNRLSVSVTRFTEGASKQHQIATFDWKDDAWVKMENKIDLQFWVDRMAISDDGEVIVGALTDVYHQNVALAFEENHDTPSFLNPQTQTN